MAITLNQLEDGHLADATPLMDNLNKLRAAVEAVTTGAAVGDLRFTALPTVEAGWLACEGQAISRATYKVLFEAIGTAFGVGDGATTFNLPDYRGRVPMGSGTGAGLTARARGDKVGVETVTLTSAQSGLPDHEQHLSAFPKGGEPPSTEAVSGQNVVRGDTTGGGAGQGLTMTTTGAFSFGVKVGAVVGGAKDAAASHTNLQPVSVCSVWIKTGV